MDNPCFKFSTHKFFFIFFAPQQQHKKKRARLGRRGGRHGCAASVITYMYWIIGIHHHTLALRKQYNWCLRVYLAFHVCAGGWLCGLIIANRPAMGVVRYQPAK